MMEAALGISVFIENRTSYDIAMDKFLTRAAAYIYLTRFVLIPLVRDLMSNLQLQLVMATSQMLLTNRQRKILSSIGPTRLPLLMALARKPVETLATWAMVLLQFRTF